MKTVIFVVVLLTAGCALKSRSQEQVYGNECTNPTINVYIGNLPAGMTASQIGIIIHDGEGNSMTLSRPKAADANFTGYGLPEKDYTAYLYLNGALTSKSCPVVFAGAYCDYNANYDYQTGQSATAI